MTLNTCTINSHLNSFWSLQTWEEASSVKVDFISTSLCSNELADSRAAIRWLYCSLMLDSWSFRVAFFCWATWKCSSMSWILPFKSQAGLLALAVEVLGLRVDAMLMAGMLPRISALSAIGWSAAGMKSNNNAPVYNKAFV